jgi:Ni,Fe-hydrogenase I large subunit
VIDAGKLHITLSVSAQKGQRVAITSTRPLHTSRLFIGKTPEQTLTTLPLLFNVCAVAQSFAAHTALSQALAVDENPAATRARQLLLKVEIIREHSWWLLINRDKAKLSPFIPLLNQFKKALFENGNAFSLNSQLHIDHAQLDKLITQLENSVNDLFAGQRQDCLALQTIDDLKIGLNNNTSIPALLLHDIIENNDQNLGRTELNLLPTLDNHQLHQYLSQHNAADFSRTPSWQGQCYETSCLNRQQHQPLIACLLQQHSNSVFTRLVSRLLELASLPDSLRQHSLSLETGRGSVHSGIHLLERGNDEHNQTGLAQIQASRGLLIHNVALKSGIISHYQIIAPTEWNFQPNAIATLSLQQLTVANKIQLQQQAAILINAIDPCVGFDLRIEE